MPSDECELVSVRAVRACQAGQSARPLGQSGGCGPACRSLRLVRTLDVPERQGEADVERHGETDDLRAGLEVAERGALLSHLAGVGEHPAPLTRFLRQCPASARMVRHKPSRSPSTRSEPQRQGGCADRPPPSPATTAGWSRPRYWLTSVSGTGPPPKRDNSRSNRRAGPWVGPRVADAVGQAEVASEPLPGRVAVMVVRLPDPRLVQHHRLHRLGQRGSARSGSRTAATWSSP
jgi:hypothetical protein